MERPADQGVCLIVGMITAHPALFERAAEALEERFGPATHQSPVWPFDLTDYYEPEMGRGLLRKFLAFQRRVDRADLAEIKLWTNDLEKRLVTPDMPVPRPINLDPGWMDAARLVLATTKDYAHRIYLQRGIYAEVTLTFARGGFRPMPWTYPDYRSEHYHAFFRAVRDDLL